MPACSFKPRKLFFDPMICLGVGGVIMSNVLSKLLDFLGFTMKRVTSLEVNGMPRLGEERVNLWVD